MLCLGRQILFLHTNFHLMLEVGRFADVNEIVKKAALDVSVIWARTIGDRFTIPLLDQKTIEKKLERLYKKVCWSTKISEILSS